MEKKVSGGEGPGSGMGAWRRPWVVLRRVGSLGAVPAHPATARHLATQPSDNLVYALAKTAARRSGAPALHLPLELQTAETGPVVSYAGLWTLVRQYAGCLSRLGLAKGDRLAAQVSKRPENLALYLATLQLGSIYLPLNTDYTPEEVRYFLGDARPTLFVCRQDSVPHYLRLSAEANDGGQGDGPLSVATNGAGGPLEASCSPSQRSRGHQIVGEEELVGLARASGPLEDIVPMSSADVASICYTSGTTGKPKGACISHGNLLSNARTLVEAWKVGESDALLHALPIYHVHGLFVALNSTFLAGASVHFLPRFQLDAVLETLPKATVMMGVPTYYARLLGCADFRPAAVPPAFRLFISGSAPLLASVWEEFRARSGGHRILERYGMTEGQMVCSNPYEGDRVPETVGFPLPGVRARVVDGVLQYKGPNVFLGYWGMPEKTKAEFTEDGWFLSGDLASIDAEGRVSILGRGKDLIISGGLNVYPKEVEDVVDAVCGVRESAVVGVPHADWGEVGLAAVVRDPLGPDVTEAQILAHAKAELAGFKVPKVVHFVESLPRNAMGKVQKAVLRERFKDSLPISPHKSE